MKLSLFLILFISIHAIYAQTLDATISVNGSNHLVITINSTAYFQFNQNHSGPVSIVIQNVYASPSGANTTNTNGGTGINYSSSIGNTGSANQIGAFGFNYGIYNTVDEELTFPDPSLSFSNGDVLTLQPGSVIGIATVLNIPTILPGPYTAFIASDDYFSIAATQINPLPVELMDFSATQFNESILLNWTTASELNNEKFEIEASKNGESFKKIAEVRGNGTTTELKHYSFQDENPAPGISYYRLKQIDTNGEFEYSNTLSVMYKGAENYVGSFFPNPSNSGLFQLNYQANLSENVVFKVFDLSGAEVLQFNKSVSLGNNILHFDCSELGSGMYFIKIGNETNELFRKIIIEN